MNCHYFSGMCLRSMSAARSPIAYAIPSSKVSELSFDRLMVTHFAYATQRAEAQCSNQPPGCSPYHTPLGLDRQLHSSPSATRCRFQWYLRKHECDNQGLVEQYSRKAVPMLPLTNLLISSGEQHDGPGSTSRTIVMQLRRIYKDSSGCVNGPTALLKGSVSTSVLT